MYWGGIFDKYLSLIRTTLNSLLRIAFKKPFHMNTDILYNTYYDILNLKKAHTKEVPTNKYIIVVNSKVSDTSIIIILLVKK